MFLINSKIVSAEENIFWNELPQSLQALTLSDCLVLTLPYPAGAPEEQTLFKMLAACKLSPNQYQIAPAQAGERIAWHKLRQHVLPRFVLLLGVHPTQLGISAQFRLHDANLYDGCTFIPALSLQEMERQPEAKKDFWQKGLKPVFAP